MTKKIVRKFKLPVSGCRAQINIIKGPKLMVKNTCKVPGVVKVSDGGVTRKALPAAVRAECKGTTGKERKDCIKTAKANIRLIKHKEKIDKWEDLGKEIPEKLYEKGEKLQARYDIANKLYEIT